MDKNIKMNLTTLAPVFVGTDEGSDLSPVTDFIFNNGKVQLINQRKFELLLSKDDKLVNEFVSEIKNKSYSFNLKNFIENKLNTSIEELTKAIIEVEGLLGSNTIKTFISTSGKPFIPGSSIKGSIRTAIIYNFLVEADEGKKIVEKLIDSAKKRHKELEDLLTKKQRERLSDNDFKNFKSLESYKSNEKEFSKTYNELRLFKDYTYGHDFRHIQISDTRTFNLSDTKITELPRIYLTKDDNKTSQWKQVLKENVSKEFTLTINPSIKDGYLLRINSNSCKSLFSMINNFSKDTIEFELSMYDTFSGNKAVENKLKGSKSFYESILKIINQSENDFAVIRVGGGKTYFDNSIGLALYKKDPDAFKEFRKLLGFWKHRSGNRAFVEEDSPITRTYYKSQNGFYPIGWVVIYPDDQKENVMKSLDLFEIKNNISDLPDNNEPMKTLREKFKVTNSKKK